MLTLRGFVKSVLMMATLAGFLVLTKTPAFAQNSCACADLIQVDVLCTGDGCAGFTYDDCSTDSFTNCQVCGQTGFYFGCCDGSFWYSRTYNYGRCLSSALVNTGKTPVMADISSSQDVALVILPVCSGYIRLRVKGEQVPRMAARQ